MESSPPDFLSEENVEVSSNVEIQPDPESGKEVEEIHGDVKETPQNRSMLIYGIIAAIVVAIVVAVILLVGGGNESSPADGSASMPVSAPTPAAPSSGAPTPENANEVRDVIVANARFGGDEFDNGNSYQSKAMGWVLTQEFPSDNVPLSFEEQILQAYALACIYFNTYGVRSAWTDFHFGSDVALPGWFGTLGWILDASDICNWYGITCNGNYQVERIDLATNGLTGSFPPEVVLLKDSLKYLDLYNNLVHNKGDEGNAFLGELTNLEYLFYGSTSFEYEGVPTEIGLLTNLKEYDMSYSLYFGQLDANMWSSLTNLNYIVMDGNAYNSSLPTELTTLPELEFLYAGFSFLEGDLSFVSDMAKPSEVWIDDNPGLSSVIPDNIDQASTLVSFSATNCGLFGEIPTQIGNLPNLLQLWLYDNELEGQIPTEVGLLSTLKTLNLQKNQLTGEMPSELCFRRYPFGKLNELEADCDSTVTCSSDCCTCCGEACILP